MNTDRVLGLALWLHRTNAARFFVCPECGYVVERPEDLGVHLERHRETAVPFGISKKVRACPKGCGRIFPLAPTSRNPRACPLDMKEHVSLCDGSTPLRIPREAVPVFDPGRVMSEATIALRRLQPQTPWYEHPTQGQAKYDTDSGLLEFRKRRRGRPPKVKATQESMA